MTQSERNAAIAKKIEAYTTKVTVSKNSAKAALKREGFTAAQQLKSKKKNKVAA